MPDMNGIEAAIHIRGFLPACKILLFSGQAATADLLENARARGHEFEILAKPVHPQDLLAKLRQYVTSAKLPDARLQNRSTYISRRPSIALCSVTSSAYSISLPAGMPVAMRVTRTPLGFS